MSATNMTVDTEASMPVAGERLMAAANASELVLQDQLPL